MLLAPRCNYMLPNHCQCPNPVMMKADDTYSEVCVLHDKLIYTSNTPIPEQVNEQIQGDRAVDKQENGKGA